MRRRGFLGLISAALAGAVLDPEKLLWEPGKTIYSIPSGVNLGLVGYGCDPIIDEINIATLKKIYPEMVSDNFFVDRPFLASIRTLRSIPFTGGMRIC